MYISQWNCLSIHLMRYSLTPGLLVRVEKNSDDIKFWQVWGAGALYILVVSIKIDPFTFQTTWIKTYTFWSSNSSAGHLEKGIYIPTGTHALLCSWQHHSTLQSFASNPPATEWTHKFWRVQTGVETNYRYTYQHERTSQGCCIIC